MDPRSDSSTPRKTVKSNQRRFPMKMPLSSIFLFLFLVSHLLTTTTVVVIATDVPGEESEASILNDIDDSEPLGMEQEPQALHSLNQEEQTNTDESTINSTEENDDSTISEETPAGTNNKTYDSSSTIDETNIGDGSEESIKENVIEDENEIVETESSNLLSSEDVTMEEVSAEDITETITATTEEFKEDEEETPSSDLEDEPQSAEPIVESEETSFSSSSEAEEEEDVEAGSAVEMEDEETSNETAAEDDSLEDDGEKMDDEPLKQAEDASSVPDASVPDEPKKSSVPDDANTEGDHPEGFETSASKEERSEIEQEDNEINEDEIDEEVTVEVNTKASARARAREDKLKRNTTNATETTEVPTAVTTNTYRGEPWGQYRSFRRLPDLELLRLVFENSNKTKEKLGDTESQKVVNEWQKDPLYDEDMAKETGSGGPFIGDDEEDPKFREYRERLLGNYDAPKAGNDKAFENEGGRDMNNVNINSNSADANSEFVEGLDDIDKFFERVNPPDDVGYGSSIQDVLMDKSKQILIKKVRGVARWIKIGWQTMSSKLGERVSEFQLPFRKTEATTTGTASDMGATSVDTKAQREQLVKNTKEALVSAWKVGKETFEVIGDFVDGLLDRFDGRGEDNSSNFEDFGGFDLDNLSSFQPPV